MRKIIVALVSLFFFSDSFANSYDLECPSGLVVEVKRTGRNFCFNLELTPEDCDKAKRRKAAEVCRKAAQKKQEAFEEKKRSLTQVCTNMTDYFKSTCGSSVFDDFMNRLNDAGKILEQFQSHVKPNKTSEELIAEYEKTKETILQIQSEKNTRVEDCKRQKAVIETTCSGTIVLLPANAQGDSTNLISGSIGETFNNMLSAGKTYVEDLKSPEAYVSDVSEGGIVEVTAGLTHSSTEHSSEISEIKSNTNNDEYSGLVNNSQNMDESISVGLKQIEANIKAIRQTSGDLDDDRSACDDLFGCDETDTNENNEVVNNTEEKSSDPQKTSGQNENNSENKTVNNNQELPINEGPAYGGSPSNVPNGSGPENNLAGNGNTLSKTGNGGFNVPNFSGLTNSYGSYGRSNDYNSRSGSSNTNSFRSSGSTRGSRSVYNPESSSNSGLNSYSARESNNGTSRNGGEPNNNSANFGDANSGGNNNASGSGSNGNSLSSASDRNNSSNGRPKNSGKAAKRKSGNKQVYSSRNEDKKSNGGLLSRIFGKSSNSKGQVNNENNNNKMGKNFDPSKYEPSQMAKRRALARATGRSIASMSRSDGGALKKWPSQEIPLHSEDGRSVFTKVFYSTKINLNK